ncbi:MAG: dihydroorotase [Myxococcota bacterium]|nr:dihydroorotase [Myxococcota bacterium]
MNPFIHTQKHPVLVRGARLIDPEGGLDEVVDLLVGPDGIERNPKQVPAGTSELQGTGLWALPGLLDIQVHFRQPGFEYKETIESGSRAALAGGITGVVVMPNTHPALDTPDSVRFESEESRRVRGIDIHVAAAVTEGLGGERLTDHAALKAAGAVAVTDDGLPVMDDGVMQASLEACVKNDLLFMQHAEDTDMTQHAPMTESDVSRALGVRGQSAEAEGVMVERDIALAAKTGARYHVLHTSTKRSIDAIREAKAKGLPISCEASPHHLLLNLQACAGGDPNTKMNPPLRSESDRQALVEALADGTVDAVATDHAPHSREEKAKGFVDAPFGVIGLETAFAALMSFVHDGTLSETRAVELMTSSPARIVGLRGKVGTIVGEQASAHLCLVDPYHEWEVGLDHFHGLSANSAFIGRRFKGKVAATFLNGELRFVDDFARDRIANE